jgi:hypothetical protein
MRRQDGDDDNGQEEGNSRQPYDALEPRLEIRQPETTNEFTILPAPRRRICEAPSPKLRRGKHSR